MHYFQIIHVFFFDLIVRVLQIQIKFSIPFVVAALCSKWSPEFIFLTKLSVVGTGFANWRADDCAFVLLSKLHGTYSSWEANRPPPDQEIPGITYGTAYMLHISSTFVEYI
jgi:hypothetical protein